MTKWRDIVGAVLKHSLRNQKKIIFRFQGIFEKLTENVIKQWEEDSELQELEEELRELEKLVAE